MITSCIKVGKFGIGSLQNTIMIKFIVCFFFFAAATAESYNGYDQWISVHE